MRRIGHIMLIISGFLLFGCVSNGSSSVGPSPVRSVAPEAATQSAGAPVQTPTPAAVNLIDPTYPLAIAGQNGWDYQRTAEVDLDADGVAERVVVMAKAPANSDDVGWDDGEPWQVYIEESSGERTYIFARWVQLGRLEGVITSNEQGQPDELLIVEKGGGRFVVYQVAYRGPAAFQTTEALSVGLYQFVAAPE